MKTNITFIVRLLYLASLKVFPHSSAFLFYRTMEGPSWDSFSTPIPFVSWDFSHQTTALTVALLLVSQGYSQSPSFICACDQFAIYDHGSCVLEWGSTATSNGELNPYQIAVLKDCVWLNEKECLNAVQPLLHACGQWARLFLKRSLAFLWGVLNPYSKTDLLTGNRHEGGIKVKQKGIKEQVVSSTNARIIYHSSFQYFRHWGPVSGEKLSSKDWEGMVSHAA